MLSQSIFFRWFRISWMVVAAVALVVTASAPPVKAERSAELKKLIEGAKKETTLRGMWGANSFGGSKGLARIARRVNKRYGVNIKTKFTPGPSMQRMMAKLAREMAAGQPSSTDVYMGNSQGMLAAQKTKIMRSYNWPAILERPLRPEWGFDPYAPNGTGVAMASSLVGIIYNSDLVKKKDVPKRLADTLKPKWKGKIASTPYAAGMREFAMSDVLGEEAVVDFTKKLAKQITGLMRCGEMDRITSGEFLMLVMACGGQSVTLAGRKGIPLGYQLLEDATVVHTRYSGVPKHSKAPNSAALIVTFLGTKEGQKLLWDNDGYDFHGYPESNQRKKLLKMRAIGAKIAYNSPQWLGKHKNYRKMQKKLQKILRGEKK